MEEMKRNWMTMGPALIGAAKLILQPFGIEIPDDKINDIVNGVAAVITIAGIIYHHMKKGANTNVTGQNQSAYGDHGPMV